MATAKSIPGDVLGCLNALFEERELKRDLMVDIPSFDFPFYPTLSNNRKFVPIRDDDLIRFEIARVRKK